MMLRALILSFVPLIAWLPGAARLGAQEHAEHLHLGRLGRVTFPVSCTAEARRRFEQAMAVLHSFWWEEGDRAFGAVLAVLLRAQAGGAGYPRDERDEKKDESSEHHGTLRSRGS